MSIAQPVSRDIEEFERVDIAGNLIAAAVPGEFARAAAAGRDRALDALWRVVAIAPLARPMAPAAASPVDRAEVPVRSPVPERMMANSAAS